MDNSLALRTGSSQTWPPEKAGRCQHQPAKQPFDQKGETSLFMTWLALIVSSPVREQWDIVIGMMCCWLRLGSFRRGAESERTSYAIYTRTGSVTTEILGQTPAGGGSRVAFL